MRINGARNVAILRQSVRGWSVRWVCEGNTYTSGPYRRAKAERIAARLEADE